MEDERRLGPGLQGVWKGAVRRARAGLRIIVVVYELSKMSRTTCESLSVV